MSEILSFDGTTYALNVLKKPSERDKQKKVGASNLSTSCERCLADDLLSVPKRPSGYWLGARIGTAIHKALEDDAPKDVETELKVTLGEIPGYGVVSSTTDLYVPGSQGVWDIKTTTREKLKRYKVALTGGKAKDEVVFTLVSYLNQIQLYGWGLSQSGKPVDTVGIIFVCRDGQGDADVWSWYTDYDEASALECWENGLRIWDLLQTGANPEEFEWHPNCFYCSRVR